jgi:hypothetical protein
MIDWSFALLFRPDIVKISLQSEVALLLHEAAAGGLVIDPRQQAAAQNGAVAGNYQHATGGSA